MNQYLQVHVKADRLTTQYVQVTHLLSESLHGSDIHASSVWCLRQHPENTKLSTDGLPTASRRSDKHIVITVVDRVEHCNVIKIF